MIVERGRDAGPQGNGRPCGWGQPHPAQDLLATVAAANIPLWVFGACAVARQVKETDLVEGATIKGMPDYIQAVAEREKVISF